LRDTRQGDYVRAVYKTPNIRRRVIIALVATVAFMVALGGFLFWYLGGQESAAKREANKFITALEKNRPADAPKHGDDYVRGVWKTYRRVDSADLLKTRQRSTHNSSNNSGYSWWVADMLVHSGRGLVVLELAFEPNHLDPDTQIIDEVYEPRVERLPGGLLDSKTLARVGSDQRERGGVANDFDLSTSGDDAFANQGGPPPPGAPTPKPPKPPKPVKIKQPPIIRCIRAAHHDVAKIQKCTERFGPGN
jgi:hypothetical protein